MFLYIQKLEYSETSIFKKLNIVKLAYSNFAIFKYHNIQIPLYSNIQILLYLNIQICYQNPSPSSQNPPLQPKLLIALGRTKSTLIAIMPTPVHMPMIGACNLQLQLQLRYTAGVTQVVTWLQCNFFGYTRRTIFDYLNVVMD